MKHVKIKKNFSPHHDWDFLCVEEPLLRQYLIKSFLFFSL